MPDEPTSGQQTESQESPQPRKPVPLREELPGVVADPREDVTPDQLFEQLTASDLNEPAIRFDQEGEKTTEEPTEPAGQTTESEPSEGDEAPTPQETEPASEPGDISGTPDEILQKYKSLQGQFGHLNQQVADLSSELTAARGFFEDLVGMGLIDRNGKVIAKEAAQPPPKRPAAKVPQPVGDGKEVDIADIAQLDFVVDRLEEAIQEGSREKLSQAVAGLLLDVQRYSKAQQQVLMEALGADLEGLKTLKGNIETFNKAKGLFDQVAAIKDESTGQYLYPELFDRQIAEEVLEIWQSYEPAHAMKPRGIYNALLEWRHQNPGRFKPKKKAPKEPEADLSGAKAILENRNQTRTTQARNVARGKGGPTITPNMTPRQMADVTATQFLRRVRESAKPIEGLGFAP